MKLNHLVIASCLVLSLLSDSYARGPIVTFRDHWLAKVKESNMVTLRPGSVYDLIVIFEQHFGAPKPKFKYYLFDTGLGAADPLYPIFQEGTQKNWKQLLSGALSKRNRHVDHVSVTDVIEGCRHFSTYWVRHIKDFPQYKKEQEQGYTLVDISFEYYMRLYPEAQCGRHRSNPYDPNFDPNDFMKQFAKNFRDPSVIPPEMLARFEMKVNILKNVSRQLSNKKWPRYDVEFSERANSLWYYPDGYQLDYGLNTIRPQSDLSNYNLPLHNIPKFSENLKSHFSLPNVLSIDAYNQLLSFWLGKPHPEFNPEDEPGNDTLDLAHPQEQHVYTSGMDMFPIKDVLEDVSKRENFQLVGAVVRPNEDVTDVAFAGTRRIPQIRLVYQLMNPAKQSQPVEQLYLHAIYDAIDRYLPKNKRVRAHAGFIKKMDRLARAKNSDSADSDPLLKELLTEVIRRPLTALNFGSSLTGIWVFGSLSREFNKERKLKAVRIERKGIDVGFYSTLYDNEIFRAVAKKSEGKRKAELEQILDFQIPKRYRDASRNDVHTIAFNEVTCAQCHQFSGRDGVHFSLNDGIDKRTAHYPFRATEYLIHELDRQMKLSELKK